MEHLRQSELHSLLAFAGNCYAIRAPEDFGGFVSRLIGELNGVIPAAHITYNEMNPEKSESHNHTSSAELASSTAGQRWEEHMNEHPVLAHVLETGDCHARRISEFMTQTELHDHGLHCDFYKHYDIEDALCIPIPCPLPRIIGVAWHDDRIFTARECLIADLVRPHIGQAWKNARLMASQVHNIEILGRGFESMSAGVILCDKQGRVHFINPPARQYLADYFGVTRQTDRHLTGDLLLWAREQRAELNRRDDVPAVRSPLVCERQNKRLVIRLLSEPDADLFLMEEEQMFPAGSTFGYLKLTVREVEVLEWIAQGKTNPEIAIILEMHTGTVKKHIEHILEKLGVETRTAAAAVAFGANGRNHAD